MDPARILVVDDDRAMREAVVRALRLEGYDVTAATDGREALTLLSTRPADVILLDVSMPTMSGLEVSERLRRAGDSTPILMLTARDRIMERVAGLDAGADDYLTKPFALDELLARIRALSRRQPIADSDDGHLPAVLSFGDITLEVSSHRARRGRRVLELTPTEFSLLELLMLHPQRVLSRDFIYDGVWGADMPTESKVLEVYLGYLRGKLEAGREPRMIQTVRGVGYVLREDP